MLYREHLTACMVQRLVLSLLGAVGDVSRAAVLAPVELRQVDVGGEIGRRINVTIRENLFALDIEKDFLEPFRQRGQKPDRYVGLGKLIDSAVHFAAHTDDEKVKALKDHLVSELIKTQLPDGYIGVYDPQHRVKRMWDVHEIVYIIFGLVSDYHHFGNRASLEAAHKLGDYLMEHRPSVPVILNTRSLNIERAFLALYKATGQKQYLDYVCAGSSLRQWHQPVAGHAYTFMNLCIAQLDLYHLQPDLANLEILRQDLGQSYDQADLAEAQIQVQDGSVVHLDEIVRGRQGLLRQSRRAVDYLVNRDGLVISGTCSLAELFHDNQRCAGNLGETCATAYLIRLMGLLLEVEGDTIYGDVMERAIYNALFAAQSPDGRKLRYFCPLEGPRSYYLRDIYCCPNNFRRIVAELPGMIYYRSGNGLAVNLYTPSTAKVKLDKDLSVTVRQETDYPNSGRVTIHLDPSQSDEFPLQLRIPRWCGQASVAVNGKPVKKGIGGGNWFTIRRQWQPGDRVVLETPMRLRMVRGRKTQAGRVAVMRGPVLFCLNPQRQEGLDGKDLKGITLDPKSLGQVQEDSTIRPNGMACCVQAWSPGRDLKGPTDLDLVLTEYADPGGEATYFRIPKSIVKDELTNVSLGSR